MAGGDLIPNESRYPDRSAPSRNTFQIQRGYVDQLFALRDTVRRVLPAYRAGIVRPRGMVIPIDPWLKGALRWARKLGGGAAVWRPDTRMRLDEGTGASEQIFYVNLIPDSLIIGTIIEVSPTFKSPVIDFDTQDFTLTVGIPLPKAKEAGEYIKVWGWPVTIEGGRTKGTTLIRVTTPSTLKLARGDRLQIPVNTEVEDPYSFSTQHNVLSASFVEEDAEGSKYDLTLENVLARDVASSETCYMRAFPAYFSGRATIPDYSAAYMKLVGPFLIDYMSGPLVIDTKVEEFVSARRYRADRDPLTPMLPADHNGQINSMPIKAEQMLFWKKISGTINHDGRSAICTCDDDGLFRLVERMRPTMTVPTDLYATGAISCIPKDDLANNEGFDIYDGYNTVRFEYKVTATGFTPAPGKTVIDISATTTDTEVATNTALAIINSVLILSVTYAGKVVNLVHNEPGIIGNNVISESVTDPDFWVSGLAGGGGGLRWMTVVESTHDAEIQIQFQPNDAQIWSNDPTRATPDAGPGVVAGVPRNLLIDFLPTAQPATHIDVRIISSPGAELKFSDWSLHGSRVAYVETETVVRIETDQWAGGFMFLKPLWANFDQLKPYPLLDKMNGGGVLL
jgi:hypothetical protein